jgi:hypothetical protein
MYLAKKCNKLIYREIIFMIKMTFEKDIFITHPGEYCPVQLNQLKLGEKSGH